MTLTELITRLTELRKLYGGKTRVALASDAEGNEIKDLDTAERHKGDDGEDTVILWPR